MHSHIELMTRHVQALYTHDSAGRIVCVNEPHGALAPRFFIGWTKDGAVLRYRYDIDNRLIRELAAAAKQAARGQTVADHQAEAAAELSRYAALLSRSSAIKNSGAGPAFAFPAQMPAPSESVIWVTESNAEVLRPHLSAWLPDVKLSAPLFALVVNGQAAAVCASVRITPQAHEAGVETAAAYRGRGYAAAVTCAWAQAVRAAGAEPLYSTSWENKASQAVARKLGLVQFGSDLHLT